MNTNSTIIGVAIALLCCMPYAFIYFSRKKKQKQTIATFKTIALEHNIQIDEFETLNTNTIGIDKTNRKVLFVKNNETTIVDLKQANYCYINEEKSKTQSISTIDICFNLSNKEHQKLTVFDNEDGFMLDGEIQFSNTWVNTINQHIKAA
ncbi:MULTISPECIES: hypothetical protein [Flavobacteriaceae]|jgi:UDP-3-O-acyl-N-acetylglucosamine deacetylase|uniref:Uncharacterized protein n=2 Tax=Flavobacteriaceae TaxID=49546 RepID=A0ABN1JCP7_9FLAO|nr:MULTISPECIES: hypothetical protein [Meridianimaribacter]TDY10543.1 hypothetical protein A8975_2269 [Meridianimaribacter flavus]